MSFQAFTATYFGSCRYETFFLDSFPARIYSTKECLYLLKNLRWIKHMLAFDGSIPTLGEECLNLIAGHIAHPTLAEKSKSYFRNPEALLGNKTVVIELGSLRYAQLGNTVVSDFFLNYRLGAIENCFRRESFKLVEMDANEVAATIASIYYILTSHNGADVEIIIIPNIDLGFDRSDPSRKQRRIKTSRIAAEAVGILGSEKIRLLPIWEDFRAQGIYLSDVVSCVKTDWNHLNPDGAKMIYNYMRAFIN